MRKNTYWDFNSTNLQPNSIHTGPNLCLKKYFSVNFVRKYEIITKRTFWVAKNNSILSNQYLMEIRRNKTTHFSVSILPIQIFRNRRIKYFWAVTDGSNFSWKEATYLLVVYFISNLVSIRNQGSPTFQWKLMQNYANISLLIKILYSNSLDLSFEPFNSYSFWLHSIAETMQLYDDIYWKGYPVRK